MPGFFVSSIPCGISLRNRYPDRCIEDSLAVEGYSVKRHTLSKFLRDKAFCDSDSFSFVTEGIILNLTSLLSEYNVTDINDLIIEMYHKEGEAFFKNFIGTFSGAFFDKGKSLWLIWTNHVGDKSVFYSVEKGLVAGSQVNYIIDSLRVQGASLSFDEQAAYQMLTFGFMEGEDTYAKEIKRLRGGQYIRYQNNVLEIKEYFKIQKDISRFAGKTEEEVIDLFDEVFRKASQMEYAKDDEYGYRYLADLSGGLDARMNMWVAHSINKKHIQFITYSKANYLDEIIAKQLAAYWNDEILIKPLDDISFLYDVDEIVFLNAGLSLYSGITGGKRLLEQLNLQNYGLEHTGQLNGGIIGSYLTAIGGGKEPTGMYSERLKHRLRKTNRNDYSDHELYMLYTRGFRGVMNTQMIRSNYTEAYTTTCHPDVVSFCFDIPVEWRINHSFYKKWIMRKYPEAATFKWEKIDARITDSKSSLVIKKLMIRAPRKMIRMIRRQKYVNTGMNPLDYWLHTHNEVRDYLDAYEKDGYSYLPSETSAQLIDDMKELYRTGSASEKTMVLTVLASAKLYFGENYASFIG